MMVSGEYSSPLTIHHLTLTLRCFPFYLLATLAIFLVRDHVFFWDTIQLGSKHAHWYFEQNFSYFLLSQEIDSGHPPTFGMYIAAVWKIFGKSLVVSHFAMLPFVFANIYLLYQLGDYFLNKSWGLLFPLLVFIDPTLAAQSVLVSPDVVVVSFFLLGILGIIRQQNWMLVLASLGLATLSMRGMMIVVVLYLLKAFEDADYQFSFPTFFRASFPFVPSGLFALAFLIFHYQQTGWIGYHTDSPWAASFERVDAKGFAKNIVIYIWRLLDFGRVFVWIPLVILLGLLFRNRAEKIRKFSLQGQLDSFWEKLRFLLSLLLLCVIVLSPSLLIYKGLLGNRYLLPIFLAANFLCFFLIFSTQSNRKWLFLIPILGLTLGNLWIYPKNIAQGWDSTLAHLPYYELRAEAYDFIKKENIPWKDVGSVFPELGMDKFRTLSDITHGFERADFEKHQYIFYSNVMNDFSDEELETLENEWQPIHTGHYGGIYVVLYGHKLE